jgi:hypothetical protein
MTSRYFGRFLAPFSHSSRLRHKSKINHMVMWRIVTLPQTPSPSERDVIHGRPLRTGGQFSWMFLEWAFIFDVVIFVLGELIISGRGHFPPMPPLLARACQGRLVDAVTTSNVLRGMFSDSWRQEYCVSELEWGTLFGLSSTFQEIFDCEYVWAQYYR